MQAKSLHWKWILVPVLAFALLLGQAHLGEPVHGQRRKPVTMLLAIGVQLGHAREMVADALGFFEEEGLEVSLQPAIGSSTQIQYMTAGTGSYGSIDAHMAVQLAREGDTKIVSPYSHFQGGVYRLVTLANSGIETPGDFKGKRIGVPSRASGAFSYLLAAAELEGVKESDMEIIPVGLGPVAVQALLSRRVDALATVGDVVFILRYEAMQTDAWDIHEIDVPMDAWPTNAVFVTENELINDRDTVVGILRAYAKAHVFIEENPEAALDIIQQSYPELVTDQDKPRLLYHLTWLRDEIWNSERSADKPYGWFDPEAWAGTDEYYRAQGFIEADESVWDIIDTSLLDEINDFDQEAIRELARSWGK